ncbi:hypothetical protein Tco_1336718 [Tanacetum coccineum]
MQNITCWNCNQKDHFHNQCLKLVASRDKEVNMARDSDDTLDIVGVGDVVLKTYFGTSWTLKDVRYIPGLKRRFILVGHLNEEGYYVGFRVQQWKVTKASLVVARGNKRGSMYMVECSEIWSKHSEAEARRLRAEALKMLWTDVS